MPRLRQVETPAARATDPMTSHLAAEQITASGKRGQQQAQAIAAVRAFPGMTSFELAMRTKLDRYMLARRLPECLTTGAVRKDEPRTCSITGRLATTWFPT
ncbi:MarR family transcriptional regulator [Luteibacter yeojuensis]|uniref:MarR family transcriptional regulator n=2 Tax=Luteibacter yeojuensis TaxID=345309 RepID=A0A7X5QT93_9GAMM|nr:MarR family transcriptional regulator [Luteibacter yeojuensis]